MAPNTYLLDVSGSSLEVDAGLSSVDKSRSADDSDRLPAGEHVEEGRLSGSRGTHESGERSGLAVTVDVVEELSVTSGNGDGVGESLPGERLLCGGEVGHVLLNLSSSGGLLGLLEGLVSLLGVLVLLGEHGDRNHRRALAEVLHAGNLQEAEAYEERNEDSKVPPKVTRLVSVTGEDCGDQNRSDEDG